MRAYIRRASSRASTTTRASRIHLLTAANPRPSEAVHARIRHHLSPSRVIKSSTTPLLVIVSVIACEVRAGLLRGVPCTSVVSHVITDLLRVIEKDPWERREPEDQGAARLSAPPFLR